MFRRSLLLLWMLGLSACASTAPDKAALDVQPAPEQAQQSAEAAPVVEAEQANKTKTEGAAVVAEKTAVETKKPQKVVEKAAVETKKSSDIAAAQKTAAQQKTASATPSPGTRNGEIRARHILVATREEAEKIIARLQGGADFGALARELSTDPTAKQNSGELGFFRRGMMVPEFEQAAFALPVGQFNREPVHTQYGWHVILVEEER